MKEEQIILRKIRFYLILFLLAILFSLHTIIFVEAETKLFAKCFGHNTFMEKLCPCVAEWMEHLHLAVLQTYTSYPVIAYCMDWLSYACVVFAGFLLGAIKNPVRNVWIVQVFMVACILAFIFPFIAGPIRDVPIFWRFIDSSFGVVGFLFLLLPYRLIKKLETLVNQKSASGQR